MASLKSNPSALRRHNEFSTSKMLVARRLALLPLFFFAIVFSPLVRTLRAQTGGHILYGDFNVDESKATGVKPINFDLILYAYTRVIARQTVSNNGRYRFMDVANGEYDIVVEVENSEVARVHILVQEIKATDIRHDIS